ncbi:MAG: hypothetical protein WDZ94_05540 [Patescibacteria group bacterium]
MLSIKNLFITIIAVCSFSSSIAPVTAQTNHYTIFINQVRGGECCDEGNIGFFQTQLQTFDQHNLQAHFALRYDALIDEEYQHIIEQQPSQEYGLLLEITPNLAAAAGVEYLGNSTSWYQAQHSMLVGYEIEDRQKLIDTMFEAYNQLFDQYPDFTTSWMIDPYSLRYIKETYGVLTHQITREQFGTDSYTLYGGPMHYPYFPTNNWALIPDSNNQEMPVIVRQTITDPVYNYGDRTNAFTSQPNDYGLRGAPFSYFEFLFNQAHQQPNEYTFALLGLENSMVEAYQQEYLRQIDYVSNWAQTEASTVIAISQLPQIVATTQDEVFVYAGSDMQHDQTAQAWWVRSDNYRARIRQSSDEIFISDIRLYHPDFTDPYLDEKAAAAGWWVVPFTLDGSRFYGSETAGLETYNDFLSNRKPEQGSPERITLFKGDSANVTVEKTNSQAVLTVNDQPIAIFHPDAIEIDSQFADITNLTYPQSENQPTWSMEMIDNTINFQVDETNLATIRDAFRSDLFPEAAYGIPDQDQSSLYVNNRYAVAGRNPVRLAFFPRNAAGNPVKLSRLPTVEVTSPEVKTSVFDSNSQNGMVLIDIESSQHMSATVTVHAEGGFSATETVYLVPNCKVQPLSCINPVNAYRYLRSFLADKTRALQESEQEALDQPNL